MCSFNDAAMWRLSILNFMPMLQTATSGVEVGTTGLSCSTHGHLARPAVAGTFTRAGTGVVIAAAVAAVLLRYAQLSQVALC